ncbi:MAG: hypothetical protein LUO89_11275 [Methanothrix sp.]|nr:hypothetical protein [Methanothrix sp.]
MDAQLEAKLAELKKLVKIPEGENPILSTADALALLKREGLLWRYEKQGAVFFLRLKADTPRPTAIPETHINMWIVNYVISMRQPAKSLPVEPAATPKPGKKPAAATKKRAK